MPTLSLLAVAAISVGLPATLPLNDTTLAGLPRGKASLTAHGKTQTCDGVWLADLAVTAGLPSGDAVRAAALMMVIVAESADGYRVTFSLGEIDAKLGNRQVLVAQQCDGKPLPAEDGPLRLVVAGEARAARSVRQLQALHVLQLP